MSWLGVVAHLALREGHEAPVLLPGRVVDLHEAPDLGLEVLLAERPHDHAVALLDLVGELPDDRVDLVAPGDVELPHQQVHRLGQAGALEQLGVVAVGPRREDQRRPVVALEQHAALVVGGEVGGPDHPVAALPAQPLVGAVEERRGRLRVLLALEEAEPAPAVVLERLEVVVDLRGDAADDAAVAQREEVLGPPVLEEGVLAPVQELPALEAQRRDPVRLVTVQAEGQVDEATEVARRMDRPDLERPHGGGQATCRRPSTCSARCAATSAPNSSRRPARPTCCPTSARSSRLPAPSSRWRAPSGSCSAPTTTSGSPTTRG